MSRPCQSRRFAVRVVVILAAALATWGSLRAQEDWALPNVDGPKMVIDQTIRTTVGEVLVEAKRAIEYDPDNPEVSRPSKQIRLAVFNFFDAVYGHSKAGPTGPVPERQRITALLARKVNDVERICDLTLVQRSKLDLAGRGDMYRLFERIELLRQRCQAVCEIVDDTDLAAQMVQWGKGVSREIQPLKAELTMGPFGEGSLFFKTLAGMLTPEQVAKYRQYQSAAPSPSGIPLTKAEEAARLAQILAQWENASSRIDRLDCQFLRFKYDRTFEVEWRGNGSLALERTGRAMYRIEPEPIKPGAIGNKRGTDGAPYQLKSEAPERWHWTGKRVLKINEKERTYEELILGGAVRPGEFEPEPPSLPQEAVQDHALRKAVRVPVPRKETLLGRSPTFGEAVLGIVLSAAIGDALSKADWTEVISQFPAPRPFLLGMSARELKNRFQIELKKETDTEVWLEFTPRLAKDRANVSKAVLILAKNGYRPMALKIVDPTDAEMVHVFKDVQINRRGPVEDLERPNLRGYRRVLNEPAR